MTEPNNTPNESSDQESLDDVLRGLSAEGSEEEQSLDDILASLSEGESSAEPPTPDADDLPNTDDLLNLEELEPSAADETIVEPDIPAQEPDDVAIAASAPDEQETSPIEPVDRPAELESWADEVATNDPEIVPEAPLVAETSSSQEIESPPSEPALPDDIIPDDMVLPDSADVASEPTTPASTDDATPFYTSPFASPTESIVEPLTSAAADGPVPTEGSSEEIVEISEPVSDSSVGDEAPEIETIDEVSAADSTADIETPSMEPWPGSDAPAEEPVTPAAEIPQVTDVTTPPVEEPGSPFGQPAAQVPAEESAIQEPEATDIPQVPLEETAAEPVADLQSPSIEEPQIAEDLSSVEETREPELPQFSASIPSFGEPVPGSTAAETPIEEPESISEPETESPVFGETPPVADESPMEAAPTEDVPDFSAASTEAETDELVTDPLEPDDLELAESATDFSGPELPNLPPLAQPAEPPVSVSQASIDTPSNIDLEPTGQPLTLKALLDRPRHRWMVPFGFILILVIIGGLGLIIFQGGQDSGTDTEESSQVQPRHRSLKA